MGVAHLDRIVVDPDILVGKPVVRGTRIPVAQVLQDLSEGLDINMLFEIYPRLSAEDIRACLEYAQALVEGEAIFPVSSESPDHASV